MVATWRRWTWIAVLIVGVGLYALVLATMMDTQNLNFVPAMILLGATIAPATFLTFAQGRSGRWQVPVVTLAVAVFFGGVIGVVVAGWLEYDTLRTLGVVPTLFVGLIEETAKLVVPLVILGVWWRRGRDPNDGLIIGVASGTGFAALETMGYAFTALITSRGNIGTVEQTLFIRGLGAPAAHLAWTGLTCGALWALAAAPTGRRFLVFALTFGGAVTLHTAWDSFDSGPVYLGLSAVSLSWLLLQLHRYRTFGLQPATAAPTGLP